ncbi:hypothetical protein [Kitasatospora sp. LaBMicrA B282]|uniref:hypothetical protein n=1 Tax=Kitasatospora sp. LaBMicrA B282 TaxID=3420949 RepID=UPI003D0E7DA1
MFGRWLLAVLLKQPEQVEWYEARLKTLTTEEGEAQTVISDLVFAELMARRFTADQPVQDISDFVAAARDRLNHPEYLPRLEAEALIRHALGEETVSLAGIARDDVLGIFAGLLVAVIRDEGLSPAALAQVVARAEAAAEANGVQLILA